ncbi:MAG: insulinase family protein [Bacteroidales bacterium]|jgi:predicted Zn-dependent peptidase|nr:insulinase family protein [Bacteroidales bacterium]
MNDLERSIPPQIHDITSCELQVPLLYSIANKIPVALFKNPNLELIHLLVKIKAGALYEEIKYSSNATYQLLKESNPDFSANDMDDFLSFHGTSWKTYINTQYITIRWIIPKKHLAKVMPILWKTISEPVFKSDCLQRFKESRIKDLEYNSAKFNYRATQLMFSEMFPKDTPIGTVLTKEHIEVITIEQLQKYHHQTFTKDNIRVFITGNIDDVMMRRLDDEMMHNSSPNLEGRQQQAEEVAKRSDTLAFSPFYPLLSPRTIIETRENALQSSFILCKQNIGYNHPDRRNFEILSVLFGGYFGSRLMKKIREEKGYTYGIFCGNLFYENTSIFFIEADVKVEKTKAAIKACFKEMKLLHKDLVSDEELTLAKSYMLGELLRDVDSSVSYQKKYAYWNDFHLDEREMQEMVDSINNITPQTIQKLAKQYHVPEMFSKIVVGKMV